MNENLRESFRIGPEAELEAELVHGGRTVRCTVRNLSAGGAKVSTDLEVEPGAACTLRVRIPASQPGANPAPWVEFETEVLEVDGAGPARAVRLRNVTATGSPQYEGAAKLVFEAQRRARARESGSSVASPMASDEERRRALRPADRPRYSRGSLRPDQRD
ncbi:MAG: hypothetical protein JWM98_3081 [Thermoleophilia bacterium]|nr:hypothetical protein [Thermoleophilia bacterium]